jgi:signal transduction histidine kinase
LSLHLPEGELRCRTDSGKIKQILYNLLSNAVKFTPEEGAVSLAAAPVGEDRVRLVVRDTGPGISKDRQHLIFEKFRQLDSSVTREHQGTGLGLAITRELVHLLGGTVEVDSDEGRGAAFTVVLPMTLGETRPRSRLRVV